MKDYVIVFLILLVIFIISIMPLFDYEDLTLNPNDYARITDVDYKAILVDELNSKGKVIITERLTFDIHAASKNNLFWELWRDLPEDYVDGLKVSYNVNSVKQILEDGTEIVYEESPKLYWDDNDYINTAGGYGPGKWYHSEGPYNEASRQYECLLFYVDGLYREKVTFEIEYEMYNAALRYKDCSELYLSLYSEETIKYLNSFKGQILIPDDDMPSPGNYQAYTYGTNSSTFPFSESDTINPGYHTFSFELDESQLKFRPYNQYIEFALISYGTDKNIFTQYAPSNFYSGENVLDEIMDEQAEYEAIPEKYKAKKINLLILLSIITVLIIIYSFKKDKNIRKKYTFYEPSMKMDYFREIPSNLDPTFVANLVFCKKKKYKNSDGYSAIMLSLVRKGYIELTRINEQKDWKFNNVKIVVKEKPIPTMKLVQETLEGYKVERMKLEPLSPTEKHYLNLIIRHSLYKNEISMRDFQSRISIDYENTTTFIKKIENSIVNIGISEGYFQKADYDQPKNRVKSLSLYFMIIGILTITLINFVSYQTYLDLAFGAFFILGFGFIISAIHLRKLSKNYVLLTQFGEDEYVKWRGLYNFLNSETLMHERTVIDIHLWEQYLVYATAFGISDKVIKALKIRCPDMEMSPILSNPYYHSNNFHHTAHVFRNATYTALSHSSGGYGGGWRIWWRRPRRWWRPEAVTK